jgi:biopolymer transport protein ExbB
MLTLANNFTVKLLLSFALLLIGTTFVSATALRAQEEGAAADGAAADAPAADAAAAPAPAPAPNAADGAAKQASKKNVLVWTYESLGLSYSLAFLGLSFTFLGLVVMALLTSRRDNVCPPDLIQAVEENLDSGNVQAAAELASNDESFLGQVLTAGFSRLDRGYAKAIEGMQEVGEEETMKLDHRLSYIALIGNVSPMVGLLGTVQGMIASFEVIASNNSTPKPAELAAGISTALFTTLVGLIIAIPAIAIFNILRNRQQRLVLEVGVASERIIGRFEPKK